MKVYRLFETLIEPNKTAPIITATKNLFETLHLDVPTLTRSKADVGQELMRLDQTKWLLHNAITLSMAADEGVCVVAPEQSSFISLSLTKDLLENDPSLHATIAQKLIAKNVELNTNVEILSLEAFLLETVGFDKLQEAIKHPFSNFSAGFVRNNNACRARKYNPLEHFFTLLNCIDLSCVKHNSMFESDGYELLEVQPTFAKTLASSILLDLFDNAADFVVVCDARSFIMFDSSQKECEKIAGRDINLTVLTLPQLLLMALGEKNKTKLGLNAHKIPATLI